MPRTAGKNPPKPRLAFRVGVSGHRWDKLPESAQARVESQASQILSGLQSAARAVRRDHDWAFDQQAAPCWRMISSLAEGADSLVARASLDGREEPYALEVVLPFDRDEYARDFEASKRGADATYRTLLKRAETVFELETPAQVRDTAQRSQCYLLAGQVMLSQVDALIAVWDGEPASGPGGTGEIVEQALQRGLIVFWLDSNGEAPARVSVPRGTPDGTGWHEIADLPEETTWISGPLADAISAMLRPPSSAESDDDPNQGSASRLAAFYEETWSSRSWAGFYNLLRRIFAGDRVPIFPVRFRTLESRRAEDWRAYIDCVAPSDHSRHDASDGNNQSMRNAISDVVRERWLWADHTAERLSHIYRSAYILNFILAALAIIAGLTAVLDWNDYPFKAACVAVEFFLVVAILVNTALGRRWGWHRRWVDYRRLAEVLRPARTLAPLGWTRTALADVTGGIGDGERWLTWYARTSLREIGLPNARVDRAYLSRIATAVVDFEIGDLNTDSASGDGQIQYHRGNARRLMRIEHGLHVLGDTLFGITLFVISAYLACYFVEYVWLDASLLALGSADAKTLFVVLKPYATLIAAALPAAGAALYGIRAQGDFKSFAEQSERTALELVDIRHRLSAPGATNLRQTIQLIESANHAMMTDLRVWGLIYGNRELSLPA